MSSGVTFYSKPDASEYVERKFLEGYECELEKAGDNEWKVYVLGKRKNKAVGLYADKTTARLLEGKYAGDLTKLYSEAGLSAKPVRSELDIENEARRKMENADIRDIRVIVSSGVISEPSADAGVIYGGDGEPELLVIHPIHKYTDDGYFDEVLDHEINHIKELRRLS